MGLTFAARLPERGFDVGIGLAPGERLAVLGPNGAGKSTLLSLLAGVLRPRSGAATLDGEVLFDLDGPRASWQPPHRRRMALMAQEPLLFPNLSVLQNVAFGPRAAGVGRAEALRTARHWLGEVEADALADRRPGSLSGGQAQRVAIARALAADPLLLLLDEPFAALDVTAAPTLRRLLRQVLVDRTAVLVTHDLLDALLLSDRVIVLDGGRVVESGRTTEVLQHPRTSFTARIAGLNLVSGTAEEGGVRQPGGTVVGGVARVPTTPGAPATAVFPPTAVSVFLEHPHGSPRNVFAVTVRELEPRDDQIRVRAVAADGHVLTADVTAGAVGELDLYPGRAAFYAVKATAVTVYPS